MKIPVVSALAALAALATLGLAGCSSTTDIRASRSATATPAEQLSEARFPDIPVPSGARMDLRQSLILGPTDGWIGRLVFIAETSAQAMFELYAREMPGFGWREITRARARISILTFTRGQRAATVQIVQPTLGGSEVTITMSPLNPAPAPAAMPGGRPAPVMPR